MRERRSSCGRTYVGGRDTDLSMAAGIVEWGAGVVVCRERREASLERRGEAQRRFEQEYFLVFSNGMGRVLSVEGNQHCDLDRLLCVFNDRKLCITMYGDQSEYWTQVQLPFMYFTLV
jgi:hypothetical protein